jgi:RDD family
VAGKPGRGSASPGDQRAAGQRAGDKPAGDQPADGEPAGGGSEYPGQRFGLPQSGSGSVGGVVRRLGALMVDWLMSVVIALAVLGGDKNPASTQYLAVSVFAAEIYLLTALTGFTVGKRLLGLRVVRLDGQPVGLLWALVRTVLFLLVIPPLVLDADLRGLHDRAARTIVIRI